MYLPSTDGGSTVTDAAREALALAGHGRAWAGGRPRRSPAERFHFRCRAASRASPWSTGGARCTTPAAGWRWRTDGPPTVATPTFIPPEARDMPIYGLIASPTLYTGQTLRAAGRSRATGAGLVTQAHDADDAAHARLGRRARTGAPPIAWTVPDLGGQPVVHVGLAHTARSSWTR